ncbi:urease accessory protein UreD [Paenibacillus cremeus]|uniref:Urease accessory protein UreD n=1 Tax=Paenibacillus cremeus TaxID=2163881 RepID=A0A559K8W0_9BACL|nr:urease accessory protein UreD [Paenibacillus cremeus]TVY08557.1 urease accessory protein UreD [Paenibacillus cremeus]
MPERVTGAISATFTAETPSTRTQLQHHAQAYPLKIAKTFPFDHNQLGVYVMDASPGVMAGDRYELSWRFGEGTNVYITNQSYTKVHPARKNDTDPASPSSQRQQLSLAAGAYVEYMPEPLMLYKDAHFLSEAEVRMEPGAALIWSEIVCPGRTHRGELFQYERFVSRMTVWYAEELIFSARQRIEPTATQSPQALSRWDNSTHLGTLYLFSNQAGPQLVEGLREKLDTLSQAKPGLYCGVSLTYKHGLAVSVLGSRVYEIANLLTAAWEHIRKDAFHKPSLLVPK